MASTTEIDHSDFEARITARIMNLEQENSQLKNEMARMKSVVDTERRYGTKNSFSCYLKHDVHENGLIIFDGCPGTNDKCSDRKK